VTRHIGNDDRQGESVVLEVDAVLPDEIDEMLMIDERHGGPDEGERAWLIEAQKFMRRQKRPKEARARRDAVEEIFRADRYMRRAANHFVKVLMASLNGL
jgi:site-specific recombinase